MNALALRLRTPPAWLQPLAVVGIIFAGVWLFVWRPKRRSDARLNALRPQLGTER